MRVIDHNHPEWKARYDRHNRVNGAFTYSQDICKWHIPIWQNLLGPDDTVATCGKFPDATVQYLHERTHVDLSLRTKLFVTTYRDLAAVLGDRGLWLPNRIDPSVLPVHTPNRNWVYYGNVIGHKKYGFDRLAAAVQFDMVAGIKDQQDALRQVAQYRYGIGVGRCALEMMAMGLKVLIFGKDFGGLILSKDDFFRQQAANFNGDVLTGVPTIGDAVARIEESQTFLTNMADIEKRIVIAWQRVA